MNLPSILAIFLVVVLCAEVESWRTPSGRRLIRQKLRTPKRSRDDSTVKTGWINQKVDHFNSANTATWKQKYYSNTAYYKSGGPVFLYISGEAEADIGWMSGGAWIEYASEFGALCYQLEHRYYGDSHPTSDMSTAHLKYLTSQQVLADLAHFIEAINTDHKFSSSTKWIVFGGSYAGNLAAWLRLKYPNLVHAAVSSSAPLEAIADFKGFYGAVATSLSTAGQSCVTAIEEATKEMATLETSSSGRQTIKSLFKTCDEVTPSNKNDEANFYLTVADYIASAVQGNSNDQQDWDSKNTDIYKICNIMKDTSVGSTLKRYAKVFTTLANVADNDCVSFSYTDSIQYLFGTSWSSDSDGDRQWLYQQCSEFGLFDTSSQSPYVFGNKFQLDYFIQQCTAIFGSSFNQAQLEKGVAQTNQLYGGKSIKVSNVVFIQGSIDPWHVQGVLKSTSASMPVIYMTGTSHCADMYSDSDTDPAVITAAHKEIRSYLKKWLA